LEGGIFTSSHWSRENKFKEGSNYGWLLESMFYLGLVLRKKLRRKRSGKKEKNM